MEWVIWFSRDGGLSFPKGLFFESVGNALVLCTADSAKVSAFVRRELEGLSTDSSLVV